jgi:hypothetical protein
MLVLIRQRDERDEPALTGISGMLRSQPVMNRVVRTVNPDSGKPIMRGRRLAVQHVLRMGQTLSFNAEATRICGVLLGSVTTRRGAFIPSESLSSG